MAMAVSEIISPILQTNAINVLLHIILKDYLSTSNCIIIVSNEPLDIRINISIIHVTSNQTTDELVNRLLDISDNRCSDYVVNMRDPKVFMKVFDRVTKLGLNRKGDKKIIILPADNKETSLELIPMTETGYVMNVLIILKTIEENCEVFDLVTHEFLKIDNDQPLYIDRWNSCTRTFDLNANLFPLNVNDLKGKTIRVATFTYLPYSILDLSTSISLTTRDGMEMRMTEEFCKWVNCTIEIVRDDENAWGDVFTNGTEVTGNGILGNVATDRADIGIGGLYVWYDISLHLDYSAVFVKSLIYCIVPTPRLMSSWEVPFMPFTPSLWSAVGCTFVMSCIGLAVAEKGFRLNIVLLVFGLLITQSQNVSSSWRVRSVAGWLLGGSLILVSAYGAGLATTFTVPKYEPAIDTVRDMVERPMEWGAAHEAWIYSLLPTTVPLKRRLIPLFRKLPPKELTRRAFTRDLAYSLEKMPGGHFAIPDYLPTKALLNLMLMAEEFYDGDCTSMFRNSSPYKEKYNDLIGRLLQSGLLLVWETQVALKYMDYNRQEILRLSRSKKEIGFVRPLNLSDLMGAFILFGFGVGLAIFIFLGEKLLNKLKMWKK